MTEIRHVVFDLGNVLVRWDPERPYVKLIPDEAARARFLGEVCNPDWLKGLDAGGEWRAAEEALIARHPDHAEMIRAFRRHWHDMVPYALGETVVILEELVDAGVDVTALSNIPSDTYLECFPRFAFLHRFRGITASGEVGLVKPDLAIYEHHAKAFGLMPAATLFFDDMPYNVEAARQAGWNAEQFVDAARMRADLKRYGVL